MAFVLIAINATCIVLQIGVMILFDCGLLRSTLTSRCRQRCETNRPKSTGGATKIVPDEEPGANDDTLLCNGVKDWNLGSSTTLGDSSSELSARSAHEQGKNGQH